MKSYIRRNKGYFILLSACCASSALFAVAVQFLKGEVLDLALTARFRAPVYPYCFCFRQFFWKCFCSMVMTAPVQDLSPPAQGICGLI